MTAREPDGLVWRKSSFSADNGGCVEVTWRKSSFSGNGGNCAEVGRRDTSTAVRDSKDALGLALDFPVAQWRAFVASLPT